MKLTDNPAEPREVRERERFVRDEKKLDVGRGQVANGYCVSAVLLHKNTRLRRSGSRQAGQPVLHKTAVYQSGVSR